MPYTKDELEYLEWRKKILSDILERIINGEVIVKKRKKRDERFIITFD